MAGYATESGKKTIAMKLRMLRKAIQVLANAYTTAFLSQAYRAYSTETRQLEAVIN